VGSIAGGSLEIAAAEMTLGFHMADHGLDGGAAAQLALDGAVHATLLPGDEDAVRVRRVVAAVSFVDIGALNRKRCSGPTFRIDVGSVSLRSELDR